MSVINADGGAKDRNRQVQSFFYGARLLHIRHMSHRIRHAAEDLPRDNGHH